MKTLLLGSLLLITSHVFAQERTASGVMETQMSWTALRNLSDQAIKDAKTAHIRMDQLTTCARKGMLYAPGQTNSDGEGCIKPLVDETAINQLKTAMGNVTTCAGQGRVFNGNSCVTTVATPPRLQCRVASDFGPGPNYVSRAGCNGDEILTGGGGQSETVNSNLCAGIGSSYIHATAPNGNGWVVDGYRPGGGDACTVAYAICCKIVN